MHTITTLCTIPGLTIKSGSQKGDFKHIYDWFNLNDIAFYIFALFLTFHYNSVGGRLNSCMNLLRPHPFTITSSFAGQYSDIWLDHDFGKYNHTHARNMGGPYDIQSTTFPLA